MVRDGIADGVRFVGTDINTKALECGQKVAEKNGNDVIEFVEDQFGTSFCQKAEKSSLLALSRCLFQIGGQKVCIEQLNVSEMTIQ